MQTLPLVEFVACGLMTSAIAWLRYLYGARMSRDSHATAARYVLPILSVISVVPFIFMGIQHPTTINQPDTRPADVGFFLGLHIVTAALAVWLVIEVGRYRTRTRDVSHRNQSYSRVTPPHRRAKIRRGKNKPR